MIIFRKIYIEGFRTYADGSELEYDFEGNGISLIQGENGVGKSTILHALYWCLYGRSMKETLSIEPWKDKQRKGFKGTKVEVDFFVNGRAYRAIRCKKYKGDVHGLGKGNSQAFLKCNGKFMEDLRDVADVNKRIVEVLGLTSLIFKSAVVFGQNMERLINQRNTDQKKVFEELFDSAFINHSRELAKADLTKLQEKLATTNQDIVILQSAHDANRKAYKSMRERYADLKEVYQKELNQHKKLMAKFKEKMNEPPMKVTASQESRQEELESLLANVDSLRWKYDRLTGDIEAIEKEGVTVQRAITEHKKNKAKRICENCGQPLGEKALAKRNKKTEESIARLQERYEGLVDKLAKSKKERKEMGKVPTETEQVELRTELANLNVYLQNAYDRNMDIEQAKADYKEWKNNKPQDSFKEKRTQLKRDIYKFSQDLGNEANQLQLLKRDGRKLEKKVADLRWVVDYALSNKGLKSYVIASLIKKLNLILGHYTQYTGFTPKFVVDLDSATKGVKCEIYQGSHIRRYEDLSGGQKQLVNVCVAFAVNELYSAVNECNLLVLDEVFESLSRNNIDIVVEIIKERSRKQSVHLITHREEFMINSSKILHLPLRTR